MAVVSDIASITAAAVVAGIAAAAVVAGIAAAAVVAGIVHLRDNALIVLGILLPILILQLVTMPCVATVYVEEVPLMFLEVVLEIHFSD